MGQLLRKRQMIIKWIAIGLILISILMLIRALPTDVWVNALREWIESIQPWGAVVFGVIYIVAVITLFPASALTMVGGAVFGLFWGTVIISIASNIGAATAFLISRHLARDRVARIASHNPKFRAIDQAIAEGGWKIVAMLRLSPAVPFNLQSYLYGVTPIRFWTCVLTSWIAMMPGTILYVYFGALTSQVAAGGDDAASAGNPILKWLFLGLGLLATVILTIYLSRLARRKLREVSDIISDEEDYPASAETARDDTTHGISWKTFGLLVVGLSMLVAAVFATIYSSRIEQWLT